MYIGTEVPNYMRTNNKIDEIDFYKMLSLNFIKIMYMKVSTLNELLTAN